MRPWVEALAAVGVAAEALDLPRSSPERAVGVFRDALRTRRDAALGGHSYGGRMASMLAAERPVAREVAVVECADALHDEPVEAAHLRDLGLSHSLILVRE